MSDNYNRLGGAATDVASGELPGINNPEGNITPVAVVKDYTASSNDEGSAMPQFICALVADSNGLCEIYLEYLIDANLKQ